MSRLEKVRSAGIDAAAQAILHRSAHEDYSPFFGIEQSDAITESGILDKVLDIMLSRPLLTPDNPVIASLADSFEEEEYTTYLARDGSSPEPVLLEDLDEEDFEEDGETVRSDRFEKIISPDLICELDFDDVWEHPAMDLVSYSSGSYDHKRKYLELEAEVSLTVGQLLQLTDRDLVGWTIKVQTALGMTEIS